jgi:hypothetical protein
MKICVFLALIYFAWALYATALYESLKQSGKVFNTKIEGVMTVHFVILIILIIASFFVN